MKRFKDDLDDFIESASTVDLMTTLGILGRPLEPRAAQDIVYDAMKLDISARNKTPASCSLWLGTRMLPISVTMQNLVYPTMTDIHVRLKKAASTARTEESSDECLQTKERRMLLELMAVYKYPVMCEKRTNEMYFSSQSLLSEPLAAGSGVVVGSESIALDYADRRLIRVEQLLHSWGGMMMNEWASSLYSSRQARYIARSAIAKQCLSVYYSQVSKYVLHRLYAYTSILTHSLTHCCFCSHSFSTEISTKPFSKTENPF